MKKVIKKEITERILSREYGSWESIANDAYDEGYVQGLAASHPPAAPVSGEELTEEGLVLVGFTKHTMIGTGYNSVSSMTDAVYYYKYGRITINATTFWTWFLDNEIRNDIAVTNIKDLVALILKYPPSATLPTREQGGEKEKFAIRFSEWLMIQCEYKNHCAWEYRGEEYTQNELIEIFKRTTPLPSPAKALSNQTNF